MNFNSWEDIRCYETLYSHCEPLKSDYYLFSVALLVEAFLVIQKCNFLHCHPTQKPTKVARAMARITSPRPANTPTVFKDQSSL